MESIFNFGIKLLIVDIVCIIWFLIYANNIYSDSSKAGPGDGIFGPILFLFFIIFPITIIQLGIFIRCIFSNSSEMSYWGYNISSLSLILVIIELSPFILLLFLYCSMLLIGFSTKILYKAGGPSIGSIKKNQLSKFFYNIFIKK